MKKRFFAMMLAITMIASGLAGCSKEEKVDFSLEEVLTALASETNIDELMEAGNTIAIIQNEEEQEVDFMESVSKLETYMNLANALSARGIKPAEETTDAIKGLYGSLSAEDVEVLIESLNDESLSDVEKARVEAGLSYVLATNQAWIMGNGLEIAEELLIRVIKAAACQASGLEVENYTSCTIGAQTSSDSGYISTIKVNDPVSGTTLEYYLDDGNKPLAQAAYTLYNIQGLDGTEDYNETVGYINEALYDAKLAAAAGISVKDATIASAKKESEAKQYVYTLTTPQTTQPTE